MFFNTHDLFKKKLYSKKFLKKKQEYNLQKSKFSMVFSNHRTASFTI